MQISTNPRAETQTPKPMHHHNPITVQKTKPTTHQINKARSKPQVAQSNTTQPKPKTVKFQRKPAYLNSNIAIWTKAASKQTKLKLQNTNTITPYTTTKAHQIYKVPNQNSPKQETHKPPRLTNTAPHRTHILNPNSN